MSLPQAECHFDRHTPTAGALEGGIALNFATRPLFVVRGRNMHPMNDLVVDRV